MDDTLAREMIRLLEQLVEQTKPRTSPKMTVKVKPMTDAEWVESLAKDPTYAGIDVKREFGKAQAWCDTNKKQCTRRFFINWLNRVERPVQVQGMKPVQSLPPVMHKVTPRLPEGEGPPPEVAAALSRLLGKDMSFIGGKR